MCRWLALLCLLLAAPRPAGAAGEALRFEIVNLHSDRGLLGCALYDSGPTWLKKSFREVLARIQGGRAVCVFSDLAPGTYAMAAYHDENANYKLDTNVFGIPKEGVCASNNARGVLGPPKWKNALLEYRGQPLSQQLRIRY